MNQIRNEKDSTQLFQNVYIERCDKETENFISEEVISFLEQPISYLKKNNKEYVYIEVDSLEAVRTDGITMEVDDVFGTFNMMIGLKLVKKKEAQIKQYLDANLKGEGLKYAMLFNQQDGLWDLNFMLDFVEGFNENMKFSEAILTVQQFLSQLVEAVNN